MPRILALSLLSLVVATFSACATPAANTVVAARAPTDRPQPCPAGTIWDRGECRPQRGIVIEQRPGTITPIPMPISPLPLPVPRPPS